MGEYEQSSKDDGTHPKAMLECSHENSNFEMPRPDRQQLQQFWWGYALAT